MAPLIQITTLIDLALPPLSSIPGSVAGAADGAAQKRVELEEDAEEEDDSLLRPGDGGVRFQEGAERARDLVLSTPEVVSGGR